MQRNYDRSYGISYVNPHLTTVYNVVPNVIYYQTGLYAPVTTMPTVISPQNIPPPPPPPLNINNHLNHSKESFERNDGYSRFQNQATMQDPKPLLLPHQFSSKDGSSDFDLSKNELKMIYQIVDTLRHLGKNGITEKDFVLAINKVVKFTFAEKISKKVFQELDRDNKGRIEFDVAFKGVRSAYSRIKNIASKIDSIAKSI